MVMMRRSSRVVGMQDMRCRLEALRFVEIVVVLVGVVVVVVVVVVLLLSKPRSALERPQPQSHLNAVDWKRLRVEVHVNSCSALAR